MNIWQSLQEDDIISFSTFLYNYYSSNKTIPFASNRQLQELKIRHNYSKYLEFDMDLKETLLQVTRSLGQSTSMSADNFHAFVEMVSNVETLQAGGSVKSLVDAFIYRALAMIEPPDYVTFDAEYGLVGLGVPSAEEKSGINYIPSSVIDYQIVASGGTMDADKVLEEGVNYATMVQRQQSILHMSVLEPEPGGVDLERCIPHVIMKMHTAAKTLQKPVMRGALTDGSEWIFLILNMERDGARATYSYTFPLLDAENYCMWSNNEEGNDIITGILACWIRRSCEPYSDEDWLKYFR